MFEAKRISSLEVNSEKMNGCVTLPILESYLRLEKVLRVSYPPLLGVHSTDS